jgi:hypothetical protein
VLLPDVTFVQIVRNFTLNRPGNMRLCYAFPEIAALVASEAVRLVI